MSPHYVQLVLNVLFIGWIILQNKWNANQMKRNDVYMKYLKQGVKNGALSTLQFRAPQHLEQP